MLGFRDDRVGGAPRKAIEPMSTIAINVSGLPLVDKLVKGQDIITKSTNNPAVPGNATLLAAFVTAQEDLDFANRGRWRRVRRCRRR